MGPSQLQNAAQEAMLWAKWFKIQGTKQNSQQERDLKRQLHLR